MFYRVQYSVTNTIFSNLKTLFHVLLFISQIAVVPFLSSVLHCKDTTIILLAVSSNILAQLIIAFNTKLWILYFCYALLMLHNTITTTARSNMSKLMKSNEIGKAFSVLGILQTLLPMAFKPAFAFMYKLTLDTFPATFKVLTGCLYFIVLAITIATHAGLEKVFHRDRKENMEEMKKLKSSV